MARLLTVTLNPALDLSAETPELTPGQVNRTENARLDAAGKGINVARVLARLGHKVTVTGLLGEDNVAPFERLFADEDLNDRFIRIPGPNRINIKIAEQGGRVTDINGPGFAVPAAAPGRLECRLGGLLAECDAVVFGGSLPAGYPAAGLARLIELAVSAGKPVWLDSSGPALAAGIGAGIYGVKPNLDELSEWAGTALATPAAILAVGNRLRASGVTQVIVSLGADGVFWLGPDGGYRSQPPGVPVVSTVCAGDTLLAGMVHGLCQGDGRAAAQILGFATALSAECVRHVGVGDAGAPDFQQLFEQTRVHPWPGENNAGENNSGDNNKGKRTA